MDKRILENGKKVNKNNYSINSENTVNSSNKQEEIQMNIKSNKSVKRNV